MTILIVEDESAFRRALRKLLVLDGHTVIEARNVYHAVEVCESSPEEIDLMIADVVMPGMNGVELAKRVAAIRPNIKVLYMSGYGREAARRRGLKDGMVFLQKPFGLEDLKTKVRQALAI